MSDAPDAIGFPEPSAAEIAELGRLGDAIVDEVAAATTLGRTGLVELVGPQMLAAWRVGFSGLDIGGRRPMPPGLTEQYAGATCGCVAPAPIPLKVSNQFGWCRECGWLYDGASSPLSLRWYRPLRHES